MTFLDDIENDNSIFFDPVQGFAETIIYNSVSILAVEDGGGMQNTGIPGLNVGGLSMFIQRADVAIPKQGDVVVYRSRNYTVVGDPRSDADLWKIELMQEIPTRIGVS